MEKSLQGFSLDESTNVRCAQAGTAGHDDLSSCFFHLILAAFFAGLSLGYAKFYFLGCLSRLYPLSDKAWVIQAVGALLTLGPCLAYVLASPLASAFEKRRIMRLSGYSAGLIMLVGLASGWTGSAWLYAALAGFLMGIFNPSKNAAIPLQACQSRCTTEKVNAALAAVYIGGMLGGTPLAAAMEQSAPAFGAMIGAGFFVCAGFFGGSCRYQEEQAHLRGYLVCVQSLLRDSRCLFKNFAGFIIGPTMLWGVASATSLAVTAYAEQRGLGGAVACSFMAVYAVAGVIAGNILATRLGAVRYPAAAFASFCMLAVILAIPVLIELLHPILTSAHLYWIAGGSIALLGLLFGTVTNLIEAEYLRLVYKEGKEGAGAALLSAMTALFPTLFGAIMAMAIISNWASPVTQFVWLAVLTAPAAVLIARLGKQHGTGMRALFMPAAWRLVKAALSLRYRISTKGLRQARECLSETRQGLLILPNHPALLDPVIVLSELWQTAKPSPVVLEKYYNLEWMRGLMRRCGAIPMPDMDVEPGPAKQRRVRQGMQTAALRLRAGGSVLFYPAGRLMTSANERLGGTSGVSYLLKEAPDLQVALVRIRGLYGSMFSKALTAGSALNLGRTLRAAVWLLMKNLIFFAPRRQVTLEIQVNPAGFPRQGSVLEINRFLENWYNQDSAGEPVLVSHSRWRKDLPLLPPSAKAENQIPDIDPQIQAAVIKKLSELSQLDPSEITADQQLGSGLGIDSLAMAGLLVWLDQNFEVGDVELHELPTVGSVFRAAAGETARNADGEKSRPPKRWSSRPARPVPLLKPSATIGEAFFKCADRMQGFQAIADTPGAVISWAALKLSVLILARKIKRLNGQYLGLLFPASGGGAVALMAALVAGKVPVMLNWTAGRRSIEHALKLSGLEHVLTSRAFIDLVPTDLEFLEERMLFIETVRDGLGPIDKLRGWLEARLSAAALVRRYQLDRIEAQQTALVLFTSGSEADPKGVPLSHRNLLSNIESGLEIMELGESDCLCSFLPPFHSFGLTVGALVPLLSGMRAVFHPNPNESRKIAAACRIWECSVMAGTPTFLRAILKAGRREDFLSLRFLISGAEKAPADLFETAADLAHPVEVIEGYGITECSPIVSANRRQTKPAGVGRPLRDVQVRIVHPETFEPLAQGEPGLILVRGPNVFDGYLGQAVEGVLNPFSKNGPFVMLGGLKWYNSGDLGYLSSGNLTISGRLKRFVKIGGEMVSLAAIEETLQRAFPDGEGKINLAVAAIETADGSRPQLYLFSIFPVPAEQINLRLSKEGFPPLVRVKEVRQIPEIPLLGSGKTDLKALETALQTF